MEGHERTPTGEGEQGGKLPTGSRRQFLRTSAAAGLGAVALGSGPLASADAPDVDQSDFHVYLLFGQSNMSGQGEIAEQDRETNSRVHVLADKTCSNLGREYGEWYVAEPPLNGCWGGIGPGDYFGKSMADAYPEDEHVGLVPAAVGGADIALFEKGAPLSPNKGIIPDRFDGGYAWMLDLAKQAQEVGTIEGILFHQGETNTADTQWKHTVAQIVSDLRSDLGIGDVPFLAGELLYENQGGCCGLHNEQIRQLPDLIDNAHVVSAEGLEGADEAHFDAQAYREFGRRYATEMKKHVDVGGGGHEDATDPDGDGDYEDVNGNGELDSADVVEFFDGYDRPRFTDHVDAYDFNDSGRIDFDDVVQLFQENFGG